MPMGDSITYGASLSDIANDLGKEGQLGGYRKHLWYLFRDANISVDFVGTETAGYTIEPPIDPDHEGHPGWSSSDLAGWTYDILSTTPPDTILLHIGTNDNSDSINGVNAILDQIDRYENDSGKSIKVYVALIIDKKNHDPYHDKFNQNLMALVGQRIKYGDRLTLVDMDGRARLQPSDYIDAIHPNDVGYYKMAVVWYNALTGPQTPGLYAYPFTLVDKEYVDYSSIIVDYATNSVAFNTKIPEEGITF